MGIQNREQHFNHFATLHHSRRIEKMSNTYAKKTDKLNILTFTELLLHGVSDTVNGGVIFGIEDIGG